MMNQLNFKQKKFLNYYIETGNAAESMRKAGYKTKWPDRYSSELLAKPQIQSALEKTREKMDIKTKLSIEYKLEVLHTGIESYLASGDYDKAAKLIEVSNRMQGHNAPERNINTSQVTISHEEALKELK